MAKKHLGIAVLEGKWAHNSNVSVRPLFDVISHLHLKNIDGYHYEMFCNHAALQNATARLAEHKDIDYMYIAAHGDEDGKGIYGTDGKLISTVQLRNNFAKFTKNAFAGVYFGCCKYPSKSAALDLLHYDVPNYGKSELCWVAGFSKKVDWLQSSAFDMLFFREMLAHADPESTQLQRITSVAQRLQNSVPDLAKELGFQIYTRTRGQGVQDVKPLIKY